MSDFLRHPKVHLARLKATRAPEILTVNGRAELVILDTETYENLLERLRHMEEVSVVRAAVRSGTDERAEVVSEAERAQSAAVVRELMAESERLGLS